jgi:hypothetical protein
MNTVLGLGLGGAAVLAVAVGLRLGRLIWWGLALLIAAYAVWLPHHRDPQSALLAPLLGGGLLVVAEAAFLATERRLDPQWLLAVLAAGVFAASVVLALAAIPVDRSVGMTIAGTVAVVCLVVLLRGLSRGSRDEQS